MTSPPGPPPPGRADGPEDPASRSGPGEPAGPPDPGPPPPASSFDPGLQSERTALAWERTAFSMMATGALFARYAVTDARQPLVAGGLAQLALGAGILVWSGFRYRAMQGPLWAEEPVVHPGATRLVGMATIGFTFLAIVSAVLLTFTRLS